MQPSTDQTDDPGSDMPWRNIVRTIVHGLWLVFAVLALIYVTSLAGMVPCWGLFVLISLVAWPIWHYRVEYLMLRRRLVLEGVMQPASRIRKAFWQGHISRAIQVVFSLCLAWLLLVLLAELSMQHWLALALDGLLLALISVPVRRGLAGSINAQHLGAIARRWPLLLVNGVLLGLAIMLIDFFLVGAPDTRLLAWNTLAERVYIDTYNDAGCVLWGTSAGAAAALEALAWHGSQLLIPGLPDTGSRLIAWAFFLLRAATVAWLVTALLLGVSIMVERRALKMRGRNPGSSVSRAFIITIILLALPFFYASVKLSELDRSVFDHPVDTAAGMIDPCAVDTARREQLLARLDSDVEATRVQATHAVDEKIEQGVAVLFMDIEQGVEQYLDWYFTVLGEYQRLAAVFTDDVAETMLEQLARYLFAGNDFDAQLGKLDSELAQMTAARFAQLTPQLRDKLAGSTCEIGQLSLVPLSSLDHDTLRASVAATSGVGAGIVASKALASKTTAAVVGKVAAKKSFQTGAALVTKTLAKKGSSTLLSAGAGTALCAPTGPVAILCGVTAGLVTWFTVDKVLVELDEALHREEMRADIMQVLAVQQALLAGQLAEYNHGRIDLMAAEVNAAVHRTFIPAVDGVR
ncbi:MAG: hypothetical protein WBO34_13065 [Gammaproteobacteria bacterium]